MPTTGWSSIAADRNMQRREASEHADRSRHDADFFARFAQRRGLERFVGIDGAAGKRDLSGVLAQSRAAHRQEHVRRERGRRDRGAWG